MTGAAILLVVISAFAHSGWNFLTKRARNPEIFTWSAALSANILLLPIAIYLLVTSPPDPIGWAFVAGTWSLHLAYFTTLSRAYRDTDLSLVYPIARGSGLLLIPVLGVFLLGGEDLARCSRRRRAHRGRDIRGLVRQRADRWIARHPGTAAQVGHQIRPGDWGHHYRLLDC